MSLTDYDGSDSTYTYNALGARIENVQVRENENRSYQNADLKDGSHGTDYLDFLKLGRALWQRVWESEVGTVHQNDYETVTRHYVVDYLSIANRDLIATEDGSYVTRYVYDANSVRISAEFTYADGTARGTTNANGEYGENPQSDFATERGKVWCRQSHLGSTLFAVDASGEVVAHTIYNAWGNPLVDTYPDANFSGLENTNNYTGYTWDETLGLYFAQNRFYAADLHRFTQEDSVKDGGNWYVYCGNEPVNYVDPWGYSQLWMTKKDVEKEREKGTRWANWDNLLYDAAQVRIAELPQTQTEAERCAAIDEIYYDEAEKLQKEFSQLYYPTLKYGPSGAMRRALESLYTDFKRPKEPTIADAALSGFSAGFTVGLEYGAFDWGVEGYNQKYVCPKTQENANPLENIKYTDKVKAQMELGDYHSFPESVDAFGGSGVSTKIVGGDGITRTKIEIHGTYRGVSGVFQYIIEPDGITCNHRLFVPN